MRRWQAGIAIVAGAIVLTLAFAPSIAGSWIYDDHALIEHNVHVHEAAWSRWLTHDFWDASEELVQQADHVHYWRPLVSASYALDWQLGGGAPGWFHLSNLVWQALATALAFVALRRWIGATGPAIATVAVCMLHPIRIESVAWISGRSDVLCTIALLVAATGVARRLAGSRGGLALEIAGTIAAYACKEQAIVLPVFVAVEVWVSRGRPALDRVALRAMIIGALPQLAVAVGYLAVRALALPIGGSSSDLGLATHVGIVLESFGRYATLAFAPHDLSLQQSLVHRVHDQIQLSGGYIALGAVSLVAMIAIAVVARRRIPGIALGIVVYLLTLVPTSNLRYTEMRTLISERFLYLPLFGIALAAGALLAAAGETWRRRGYLIAAALALVFATLVLARSVDFRDEGTLWERELELHPESEAAHMFLVEEAVHDNRFEVALELLEHLARDPYDRALLIDLTIASLVASVGVHIVPDRDRDTLHRFDDFCRTLVAADRPQAILDTPVARFAIDLRRDGYRAAIAPLIPNLLVLRAQIASRLGDDDAAVALATDAGARCATCMAIRGPELEVLAGAGRFAETTALIGELRGHVDAAQLDVVAHDIAVARQAHDATGAAAGLPALRLRAKELAALNLWGRAYSILAPYTGQAAEIPELAELAFKAGDRATAGRLLGPDGEAQMAVWSESLGLAP